VTEQERRELESRLVTAMQGSGRIPDKRVVAGLPDALLVELVKLLDTPAPRRLGERSEAHGGKQEP
jgi:hypothetical protein